MQNLEQFAVEKLVAGIKLQYCILFRDLQSMADGELFVRYLFSAEYLLSILLDVLGF